MSVQTSANITNKPFFLYGMALTKGASTVVQDAGRSGDMELYTLMAYDPATGKWTSFTDETGTDGTQFPRGILLKKLTEAEIKAGDVEDVPVCVGGGPVLVDQDQVVIENSKTLATVINVPTNLNISVEEYLRQLGIFMQKNIDITEYAA